MSKTLGFVAFALGAAIGSVATWYVVKTKYERIAQEEIDSVKEVFSNRETSFAPIAETKNVDGNDISKKDVKNDKDDIMAYSRKLNDEGYTDYSNVELSFPDIETKEKTEEIHDDEIYIIPPEEFGEVHGYDTVSLTLYSDDVLTDEFDEKVEDIEGTVRSESLTHFGEYEDDSVFVRNDRLKCDFEILLDVRKYSDVRKTKPHQMEEFYEE